MQCYTELTPPTAVTHALSLSFLFAESSNLAVAKSSLLQIFTIKAVPAEVEIGQNAAQGSLATSDKYTRQLNDDDGLESSFLGGDAVFLKADAATHTKLVLVAEFPLAGTITGLAKIKTPQTKSDGDALLIAFKDAKLSLVEWDPDTHGLCTVSIHYYEQEELFGSPWAPSLSDHVNFLVSDPGSRCAALKFGVRNLAILPFTQPDEDIDMENWDEELDGPKPAAADTTAAGKGASSALMNGTTSNSTIEQTPYAPSFVLRLSNLDASLLHPVHLAFLHEYREPTFGILSSTLHPSSSLGRRDHLTYMVFTLDLQQKASTTILSVSDLPQDLSRVVALPVPIGGALLVGTNELIHIDQSGKPNGVAVNPLTKHSTSFGMADQSDLNLRLEGCNIEVLSAENGELLLITSDGRLGLITFRIDGRTVSGLTIKLLPAEAGLSTVPSSVSCLSSLTRSSMFVGSEDGDSLVLGWSRKQTQPNRRKSRMQEAAVAVEDDEYELEDEEDDDDDLYSDEKTTSQPLAASAGAGKPGDLTFSIQDQLFSSAPIQALTYGKPTPPSSSQDQQNSKGVRSDLQLVCAVGRGRSGALAILNSQIQPQVIGRFDFPEAKGMWAMSAQKPVPKSLQGDKGNSSLAGDYDATPRYDRFMIVAKVDLDGYETSDVYALTAAGFEALTGTEFEPAAGFTVEAGTMGKHKRIIQVLKSEVRCYDGEFGLSQILPMLDEETGADPRVLSASIADPYLLLIRDDSSVFLAGIDKNNELEEIDKEDKLLVSGKWQSGCLYTDVAGAFSDSGNTGAKIFAFLLSVSGDLYIYALPDLRKAVYVAEGISYVPPVLSASYTGRKGAAKETLKEILVADLGDANSKSPYLIIRHVNDDLTIYEPWRTTGPDDASLAKTLRFHKLSNPIFAKEPKVANHDDDESTEQKLQHMPLRVCPNVAGYSAVFLPAASPSFIIKSSKSLPRVIGLHGTGVQAMSSFHTEGCEQGFIYSDFDGIARVSQLPADCNYAELGVAVKKVAIGADVTAVAYHPPSETYVVATAVSEPFELPKDDDYHKEWARENIVFKPTAERGILKVVNPINWTVVDSIEMEPCEMALCVETINLEISESTNERKQLVTVGTAVSRGEDLPIRGRIYVYDVVEVIPEPGRPETNRKLKLVAREDIPRGAVTAISAVGTQGLMLVAQGQKCMVRGLKEDGTLLPVAFMDMNCYVTAVRELPGTGLCLMADAFKGVWFTGYTEEPYKMMLFGKSTTRLEVVNVDFLPDGRELFIVACDADANLHVLQFDPEHPKSLQGHLLLHRTSFNTGAHLATHSLLLPNAASSSPDASATNSAAAPNSSPPLPESLLLTASPTGVLATLRPLAESSYRHLSALAVQLATALPHPAGLNPKMHRAPQPPSAGARPPGVDAGVGRTIVDGALLARWAELGRARRVEIAGRMVGGGSGGGEGGGVGGAGAAGLEIVRAELEGVLGWGALSYF